MVDVDAKIAEFAKRKSDHDEKVRREQESKLAKKLSEDEELSKRKSDWSLLKQELISVVKDLNGKLLTLDRQFHVRPFGLVVGMNDPRAFDGIEQLSISITPLKSQVELNAGHISVFKKGTVSFKYFDDNDVSLTLTSVNKTVFEGLLMSLLEHSKLTVSV